VTAPWNQADSGKIVGSAQGSSTTAIARRLPPTWRRALCLHNRIFLEADNIILKLKDFFRVVQVNPGAEFSLEKGCSWKLFGRLDRPVPALQRHPPHG
jgi:hypothetical protein